MKKLLKSILIATASLGAVAGSTAAIISCGSNGGDNTDTPQGKYDAQANAVAAKVKEFTETGTNPGFPVTQYQTDLSIKEAIASFINEYMKKNPADMLSNITDPATALQFLAPGDGQTFSASFPGRGEAKANVTTLQKSTGIKLTMPKSEKSTATIKAVDLEFGYQISYVANAPTSTDYAAAITSIQNYFKTNTLFSAYEGITNDDITKNIQKNIFTYITTSMTDNQQRASLQILSQDDIIVKALPTTWPPFTSPHAAQALGQGIDISITINPTIELIAPTTNTFALAGATTQYDIISKAQHTFNSIEQTLNDYFAKNNLFTISLATWSEDNLRQEIEKGILDAIPKALSADQIAVIIQVVSIPNNDNINIAKPSAAGDQVMKSSDRVKYFILSASEKVKAFFITEAKYTVT